MSNEDQIIHLVEQDRLKKALPIYNELLIDLDKKPQLKWSTWLFRSLSFLTFLAALTLASLSIFFAATSSKNYGTNYVLVDIQNPYGLGVPVPTLTTYVPDQAKALQDWVFRAGPGAQYHRVGGNTTGTPGSGDQQFQFQLPSTSLQDQIVSVTNASISEITLDSNTNEQSAVPNVFPFPVQVLVNSGTINIPKKTTKTFVYHTRGWFNVGQMDQNV